MAAPLRQRLQLGPRELGMDPAAEAAVGAGDHVPHGFPQTVPELCLVPGLTLLPARLSSIRPGGRGRLPACVVRIRSLLLRTPTSFSTARGPPVPGRAFF